MATIIETNIRTVLKIINQCQNAKFNTNIADDIRIRIQCLQDPLINLQVTAVTKKQADSLIQLNQIFLELTELIKDITTKRIVFKAFNTSRNFSELTNIFHRLTGLLNDCGMHTAININKEIRLTESLLEEVVRTLTLTLSKIQNIDDFDKENIIGEIAVAIKCNHNDLKELIREYMTYIGISKSLINDKIGKIIEDNLTQDPLLTNISAFQF